MRKILATMKWDINKDPIYATAIAVYDVNDERVDINHALGKGRVIIGEGDLKKGIFTLTSTEVNYQVFSDRSARLI